MVCKEEKSKSRRLSSGQTAAEKVEKSVRAKTMSLLKRDYNGKPGREDNGIHLNWEETKPKLNELKQTTQLPYGNCVV